MLNKFGLLTTQQRLARANDSGPGGMIWPLLALPSGTTPKAAKTSLVVKEEFVEEAERIFADTNISITSSGKRHLGAAIGSQSF